MHLKLIFKMNFLNAFFKCIYKCIQKSAHGKIRVSCACVYVTHEHEHEKHEKLVCKNRKLTQNTRLIHDKPQNTRKTTKYT